MAFSFSKMAQSRSEGYDYQFVEEEASDDLKCLICLCVARDPQQHGDGGCGKIFCRSCIDKYKKNDDKCPNCRKVITTFKDERSKCNPSPPPPNAIEYSLCYMYTSVSL